MDLAIFIVFAAGVLGFGYLYNTRVYRLMRLFDRGSAGWSELASLSGQNPPATSGTIACVRGGGRLGQGPRHNRLFVAYDNDTMMVAVPATFSTQARFYSKHELPLTARSNPVVGSIRHADGEFHVTMSARRIGDVERDLIARGYWVTAVA